MPSRLACFQRLNLDGAWVWQAVFCVQTPKKAEINVQHLSVAARAGGVRRWFTIGARVRAIVTRTLPPAKQSADSRDPQNMDPVVM